MSRIQKIVKWFLFLFLISGCTLVNDSAKPDTKKHLLQDIDNKVSQAENSNLYSESSSNEEIVEDLSNYISLSGSNKYLEEVTNLSTPIKKKSIFNSTLMVVKKKFDKKKVKLSIEEMPLNKFLHLVFAKVLKVDYVLDKSVQNNKQPVSINIKKEISKEKLLRIVNTVLEGFNIIIDIEKNIFYVKQSTQRAVESVHKIYLGNSIPQGIDDNDVIFMMRPYFYNKLMNKHSMFVKEYFLSKKGFLEIDTYENIIKIRDKVKNIKKALEFYDFIDQPTMRNKNMKLVRMENMDVEDFIEQVKPIIQNYGIIVSEHLRSSGIQFVPIKQINAFLILSDKESWMNTVLFWKKKLDIVKKSNSIDSDFFVYKPQNRKAEELVKIINDFSSAYRISDKENNKDKKQEVSTAVASKKTGGNLKVVLDAERNNIIIYTSKKQYQSIEKMLRRLDTLPKQVLVEVTIAEVILRDSLQFGLEWFLKHTGSKYGNSLTALGSGSAGILGRMFTVSGDMGITVNALAEKKYVNVLSNPKLLVLNNHSASINIGNQVPIITSQASASDIEGGGGSSILQNIQYQSTGITLAVTPIINSEGYLTLNISQSVSNAQKNTTSDISSPLIFNRSLSTDVILKTGESVLLGGLITEDKSKDTTKIPFLGDLPILGKLFSTSGDSIDKTELVILVKPTIISTNRDATIVTEALLDLMNFK